MEPTVFHSLAYRDAPAAVESLTTAFGFESKGVHTDPDDPSVVAYAQLDWPPGGGIMLGSARGEDSTAFDAVGHAQCYCVTVTDEDVDAVHARAMAVGATSVRAPEDQGYGDPEGHQWSFGSYRGE